MSSRFARITVFAFCFALVAAFASVQGSFHYFKFKLGNFDRQGETQAIRDTIKFFSGSVAGFFDTGGMMLGLNTFPAETLVKRRIFQDTRYLGNLGLLLAYDRDRSDFKKITFIDLAHAEVVVDESWFMAYQNIETRKLMSNKKANIITVRYFMKKISGKWGVVDFEVYNREDIIPSLSPRRVMQW